MRSSIPFAGALLQAGLSIAKPYLYEREGMVYNVVQREATLTENKAALEAREISLEQANVADSCLNSYNLVTTSSGPYPTGEADPDFDFFSFCSSYIRSTKTYTVTQLPTTAPVVTITVTATKSTTTSSPPTSSPPPPLTTTSSKASTTSTTSPSPSTTKLPLTTTTQTPTVITSSTATSSLCPSAVAGQSCGVSGWGYAENNLYSGSSISAAECHQLCLANPDCKSFQTQDSSYTAPLCNLYKVDSSGNNTIAGASSPYIFYDRGCPDFAPAACTTVASPITTAKPTLSADLGKEKRQGGSQTLPWFLESFGSETVSQICSCIITLALPTISYTITVGG